MAYSDCTVFPCIFLGLLASLRERGPSVSASHSLMGIDVWGLQLVSWSVSPGLNSLGSEVSGKH